MTGQRPDLRAASQRAQASLTDFIDRQAAATTEDPDSADQPEPMADNATAPPDGRAD